MQPGCVVEVVELVDATVVVELEVVDDPGVVLVVVGPGTHIPSTQMNPPLGDPSLQSSFVVHSGAVVDVVLVVVGVVVVAGAWVVVVVDVGVLPCTTVTPLS